MKRPRILIEFTITNMLLGLPFGAILGTVIVFFATIISGVDPVSPLVSSLYSLAASAAFGAPYGAMVGGFVGMVNGFVLGLLTIAFYYDKPIRKQHYHLTLMIISVIIPFIILMMARANFLSRGDYDLDFPKLIFSIAVVVIPALISGYAARYLVKWYCELQQTLLVEG